MLVFLDDLDISHTRWVLVHCSLWVRLLVHCGLVLLVLVHHSLFLAMEVLYLLLFRRELEEQALAVLFLVGAPFEVSTDADTLLDLGFALIPYPKAIAFAGALAFAAILWLLIAATDLGKAIRAVAREREGARLVGIRVEHIYAMTFGIGTGVFAAVRALRPAGERAGERTPA